MPRLMRWMLWRFFVSTKKKNLTAKVAKFFTKNTKVKFLFLDYLQSVFDSFIDFFELGFGNNIRWQNINNVANRAQNDSVFDKKFVEFVAQISVVTFLVFGFDF
jgi:hypothetical protein